MKHLVDRVLNHVTMYRLMLYYTGALLVAAFGLGLFGLVPADPTALVFSTVVIVATCWATNRAFAWLLRVPVNAESVHITALILALIMPPVTASDHMGLAGLVLASVAAIASKFLLAVDRKHIFNPVALGAVVSGLALGQPAIWWLGGNSYLLPIVLIGGLMVTRKVQRLDMIGVYVLANLAAVAATTPPEMAGMALQQSLYYSPLFFAGFAMLTEPLTAAHGRVSRLVYGAIVGVLSSPNIQIGGFYLTPEIAFLVGNLYAWAASPKGRFKLTLLRVEEIAAGCYDYVFHSEKALPFRPGQYLDWTLHLEQPDSRGNRRPFTIASAPTENEVRLGVKFYPQPSAFKRKMIEMMPGDVMYGSQIAGTFTLPRDPNQKLAFIAGGIGITPFRSIVQDLVDRGDEREIVLLYGNNRPDEIAYGDLFERARRELGMRAVYAVAEGGVYGPGYHNGFIDEDLILREVPDLRERTFYISGPRGMVVRFEKALRRLGVRRSRIKVDFFPGFA
ncbi:hypothetical protein [Acidimangrovimonas pyrenivorans]|uniref:FAD-binding FR-type domain-containing protein n=1 Tax=Acidimangrovimonas pyrenivorans TaxID=2030798 RepID=A0ABV7ACF9_9RHOB